MNAAPARQACHSEKSVPPADLTFDGSFICFMSDFTDLVRRVDPDRFLAGLFVPADKRAAYFLLCAFNHELARAREVVSTGMLALIRLQWWREVVEGTPRRHEVAEPLAHALQEGVLDRDALLAMIEARETEADSDIADMANFTAYLEGTAGGFAVAAGRLLGAEASDEPRLRRLGAVYGLAGQLANVTALARAERCLLPADVLARHDLTPAHVIHDPRSAVPAISALAGQGLAWFDAARGPLPRQIVASALPAALGARDLRRGGEHRRLLGDRLALTWAGLFGRL
jgi:phytoene synthase